MLELGSLQKSYRLPTARNSRALGVEITHEALGKTELNLLMDSLAHASEFNGGKLGLLPNDLEPDELILARIRGDEIDVTDAARNFQPRDISHRLQTVKLVFEPA